MRERKWLLVAGVLLLGLGLGYLIRGRGSPTSPSRSDSTRSASPSPPAAAPAKSATAASTIEGEVEFTGPVPALGKLHREADPYCAKTQIVDPTVLVKEGKLANVWVHVTKGAPDAPAPGQPVEMDQRDCMYVPRVAAAVVGQKISAHNGDPILHNVHAYLGASTVFNRGMPNQTAAPSEYVPNQEGVMKWKCDVHPWMRGYIGISRNPLQSVTGATGAFRIGDVPPGRYTIEAWHEKYGAKSQEVTVRSGVPARVTFKFDGSE